MKWYLVALIAMFLVGGHPRSTFGQSVDGANFVRSKLTGELEQLIAKSYRQDGIGLLGAVTTNGAARFPRQLEGGVTYAIVGACDSNCTHVRLSLFDGNGGLLIASPEQEPIAIVVGTPDTAGPFEIELAVPGCREVACQAGLIVARLDQTDPGGKHVSPAVPPDGKSKKQQGGTTTLGGKTYRSF